MQIYNHFSDINRWAFFVSFEEEELEYNQMEEEEEKGGTHTHTLSFPQSKLNQSSARRWWPTNQEMVNIQRNGKQSNRNWRKRLLMRRMTERWMTLWFPVVSSSVSFLLFPPRCVHSDVTLRSRCVYRKLQLNSVCKHTYLSCFYKKPLQVNRPFPVSSCPLPVGERSLPVVTEGSWSVPDSLRQPVQFDP